MHADTPSATFGPVTVFFGGKNGKYPDGNQVVVRGADTLAVFDTPQVSNRIGAAFDDADLGPRAATVRGKTIWLLWYQPSG